MAQHGGRRPGAGRPKGSTNKLTAEQVEAVQQGITPLEYLLSVMRSPLPPELQTKLDNGEIDKDIIAGLTGWHDRRMEAAKSAAPFVHAKLSSVEMNATVGIDHESALDELEGETDTSDTED